MRRTMMLALTLFAAPLAAQQQQAVESPVKLKSAGLPAGWTLRLDDKERRYGVDDAKFETMGAGLHVTSGPAAIYWNAKDQVKLPYTVSATFGQRKSPAHAEAYGLFVGGTKLETKNQEYLYFLVRKDGMFYVAHRAGADVHKIVDWTAHPAVKKEEANGSQTNALAIQATMDSLHLMVNGQRVKSFSKADMYGTLPSDQVGLRVNHGLDVHISDFQVKR